MSTTSRGAWVERGDAAFPAARASLSASAWQPDRTPAAIARPRGVQEVRDAVGRARDAGWRVAVRSGGHSLSWTHLVPDAVTLDLRELRAVEVDAESGTARVGPGVTVREAARALDDAGASFPLGHAPTVGLGGYLLAGGNGWNTPVWGHGCERVVAADVVLPDASLVRVDAAQHPELFRAVRGAGPAFPGVVVALELRLVPERARVARVSVSVAADRPAELGAALDAVVAAVPPHVELTVYWHPARARGAPPLAVISATAFGADAAALDALRSAPFVTTPPPVAHAGSLADVIETLPDHSGDAMFSHHTWTDAPYGDVLPRLPGYDPGLSACSSVLLTTAARRADARPLDDARYVPSGRLSVGAYAHWDPNRQAPGHAVDWARRTIAGLDPVSTGRYVGEADLVAGSAAFAECFPPAELDALRATARHYDPDGVVATPLND